MKEERMKNSTSTTNIVAAFSAIAMLILFPCVATAQNDGPVIVNVDNFVRAETAAQFDRTLKLTGGVNKWFHFRQPTPLDQQSVIRMNRDTLCPHDLVNDVG